MTKNKNNTTKLKKLKKVINNLKKNYKINKPINEIRILKDPFHPKKKYKKIFEVKQRDLILYYNDETCSLAIYSCDYAYEMAKDNRKFSTAKLNTEIAKKLEKYCRFELDFTTFEPVRINELLPGIGFKRYLTGDINTRYFINEREKLVKYYISTKDDVLLCCIFELLKQKSEVQHTSSNSIYTLKVGSRNKSIKVTIDYSGEKENEQFLYFYSELYNELNERFQVPIDKYDKISSRQTNYYFIYRIFVLFGYTPFFKSRYFDAAYYREDKLLVIYSHTNDADTFKNYDRPTRKLKCISAHYK